jgi:hypothetical protein
MKAVLNRLRRTSGVRRFLSRGLTVEGFFQRLNTLSVQYVVLRWYETLPHVEPGEDIDLLVEDADLPKLVPLLQGQGTSQPFDLYGVSGGAGTNFRGVPYYPPKLGQSMLQGAVLWKGTYRVPNPLDAFLSMAYHAVYHKGGASGLPFSAGQSVNNCGRSDHDYAAVLAQKAALAGVELDAGEISLDYLDEILASHGWRPQADTLEKLGLENRWITAYLARTVEAIPPQLEGLACFLVRERGVEQVGAIRKQLSFDGFDILAEGSLSEPAAQAIFAEARGGVWGRGPWPVSGGPPAYFIMAYDALPVAPTDEERIQHPGMTNRRLIDAKIVVRDIGNRNKPPAEHCNIMHSSDNGRQALHYLRLIDAGLESQVRAEAERINREHQPPFEVVSDLGGNARRARVCLVKHNGRHEVAKFFRPGRERFLDREVEAREIGAPLAEVSQILEAGRSHIVIKRYSSAEGLNWFVIPGKFDGFLRPVHIKAIRKVLLHFRHQGYECIDLKPGNFFLDPAAGIKVIDFEFTQKTSAGHDNLVGCLAWYPPGEGLDVELPAGAAGVDPYSAYWQRQTGVPRRFCVHDVPVWLMTLAQAVSFARYSFFGVARRVGRRLLHWLRHNELKIFVMSFVRRLVN